MELPFHSFYTPSFIWCGNVSDSKLCSASLSGLKTRRISTWADGIFSLESSFFDVWVCDWERQCCQQHILCMLRKRKSSCCECSSWINNYDNCTIIWFSLYMLSLNFFASQAHRFLLFKALIFLMGASIELVSSAFIFSEFPQIYKSWCLTLLISSIAVGFFFLKYCFLLIY